jgi:ATP-binding cassette subfamily F protein 3
MIQISNLNFGFGGRDIFIDASFHVSHGEKIALVGRNGTGKSTLFKIINGEVTSDQGEISSPKNYSLGTLKQHLAFTESNIVAECCKEGVEVFEAEKILMGLGFSEDDFQKAPETFSGGFQIRIELAKCLLQKPDMLLLDEPSNYLDITSLRWLKNFLKRYPGEMILISHDQSLLNTVCTHTMGIHRKKIKKVPGEVSNYYDQLALDLDLESKTKDNIEKKKKEMQAFVDRFRAKARKASQAQSRLKKIEKLNQIQFESDEQFFSGFKFNYKELLAKNILEVKELSFSYPGGGDIIKKLNFYIKRDSRMAIIGKNGKGKSTLLNLCAGILKSTQGNINPHSELKIGHFGQTNIDNLHPTHTVFQEISLCNTDLGQSQIRAICGAMAFTEDDADKKISVLSGGEKSRVMLGKILATPCNLLLLDEPTNHLDIESVEILKQEIDRFPGAVVFVSHDENFLSEMAEELVVFHHDKVEYFLGDYKHFLEKVGWEDEEPVKTAHKNKLTKKEINQIKSELAKERSQIITPLKKEYQKYEKILLELEARQTVVNQELLEASENSDGDKITKTSKELNQIETEIENCFLQLEELETRLSIEENKLKIKEEQLLK